MDYHSRLNEEQRELLRLYSVKSWQEDDMTLCFEVAAYRLDQINAKGNENG